MISNLVKFFEPLAYPIGFLWLLLLAGGVRFAWKRQWVPALFSAVLAVGLSLIGSTSIPERLLASLEQPYARDSQAPLPQGDAVVMLGGTVTPSQHDLFGLDLTAASDRAIAAQELMRQKKARWLVLGGGGTGSKGGDKAAEALHLQKWLGASGIPAASVITLQNSANTYEEAVQVQKLAQERGWKRVILVTSGFHMKRAAATFQRLAIPVVPLACDFTGLNHLEGERPFQPFPKIDGVEHLTLYLHEVFGWHFYRWRGWIGSGAAAPEGQASPPKEIATPSR